MNADSTLEVWRSILRALERGCPWPGPRPLDRTDDHHLLVGRESDRKQFRREIDSHRLILLAGSSGVGKTSLLEAGLVPELEESGYAVALCRDWSGRADETDPASFLADRIRPHFEPRIPGLGSGARLFWDLQAALGRKAVIVLDQFEELIRYDEPLTKLIYKLILELNQRTKIKVVISFRSEFLHMLRPVETQAESFSISRYMLDEIDDAYAQQVIEAPNRDKNQVVATDAAELIANTWHQARGSAPGERSDPFHRVGLLHLQALLYALNARADKEVVSADVVKAFADGAEPAKLFTKGLLDAIEVKLARCRQASAEVGLDRYLVEGTVQTVAKSVRHLSSAGYKLPREALDLLDQTLGADIETLGVGLLRAGETESEAGDGPFSAEQYEALVETIISRTQPQGDSAALDLLEADYSAIAEIADGRTTKAVRSWQERLHLGSPPDTLDPADVTCGPLSEAAPASVLIEELRRFSFALAWLQETSLVRVSRPSGTGLMVSLIHDGFGEALQRWSETPLQGPRGPLHALTAPRGASFGWQFDRAEEPEAPELRSGTSEPRVLPNLRWRGGWVRASFKNLVFVNCDFRGTFFDRCAFTGVTFMNCLLDGVIFSDCKAFGKFAPGSSHATKLQPLFFVPVSDHELLRSFAHYRRVDGEPIGFFSPLPGRPAVPVSELPADVTNWSAEPGGLVIYGGRVSSLVFRSCEGALALRHVAGSGLDVVEQSSGTYEIHQCLLRHFSVTAPVEGGSRGADPEFAITANGSSLFQCWIGDHVSGSFEANDCTLVQVWNGSRGGSKKLDFRAHGCRFHDAVNVTLDESCTPTGDHRESGLSLARVDPEQDLAQVGKLMDYRRNPAESAGDGSVAPAATPLTPSTRP